MPETVPGPSRPDGDPRVRGLLDDYVNAKAALRSAGVVRSERLAHADYAEWLACRLLDLTPAESGVQKGFDAVDGAGVRYQVKCRIAGSVDSTSSFNMNEVSGFDVLVGVFLSDRLELLGMFSLDIEAVQSLATRTASTYRLRWNAALARDPRLTWIVAPGERPSVQAQRRPGPTTKPAPSPKAPPSKRKRLTPTERETLTEMRLQIRTMLAEHDRIPHSLYRTCQERFGYENPPPNLLAHDAEGVVHIFLDFEDVVADDALRNVWAIPHERVAGIRKLPATRLSKGVERVDFENLDPAFRFNDLQDLRRGLPDLLR